MRAYATAHLGPSDQAVLTFARNGDLERAKERMEQAKTRIDSKVQNRNRQPRWMRG